MHPSFRQTALHWIYWIDASVDRCLNLSEELQKAYPYLEFYFGGIFYRDPIDSKNDKHEVFDLTKDIQELKDNFGKINAEGGGDIQEDWVGAYSKAINNINWKDGTKLIIHFADAPAHTKEFCGENVPSCRHLEGSYPQVR